MSTAESDANQRSTMLAMPLLDHLRELRKRLFIAAVAISLGSIVAWFFYEPLIAIMRKPWDVYQQNGASNGVKVPDLVITGIATPFTLQLQISVIAGIVITSPIWLYELWAFVTPGLHKRERQWTVIFLAVSVPLFAAGVWLAYIFLPHGLQILLGFTPTNFSNLITASEYFTFVTRMLLVFGVAFLLPVFVVLLNAVGILSAGRLRSWWRGITFGVFVFAAVATPTGDPWTMLALATPMLILLFISFAIAWSNDRRRTRAQEAN